MRITAGIIEVPPAGVEAVAAEGLDPLDAGQLGPVEQAVGLDDVAGADGVVAVGGHQPAMLVFEPAQLGDARL